jgi:hypothetical protein
MPRYRSAAATALLLLGLGLAAPALAAPGGRAFDPALWLTDTWMAIVRGLGLERPTAPTSPTSAPDSREHLSLADSMSIDPDGAAAAPPTPPEAHHLDNSTSADPNGR